MTQVEEHRRSQVAVSSLSVLAAREAFDLIDPADLPGTLPRFKAAVQAVVHKYGQASASLAARFYTDNRRSAGVASRFTVIPADPAGWAQIEATLDWATRGLWSADHPNTAGAQADVAGVTQKLVQQPGRQTVLDNVVRDRKATGWARAVSPPHPCYFCIMLAIRGPVYKSDRPGGRSDYQFVDDPDKPSEIKVHDHCHCYPVPVYTTKYSPSEEIQGWRQLWESTTSPFSGPDKIRAFRRALNPAGVV